MSGPLQRLRYPLSRPPQRHRCAELPANSFARVGQPKPMSQVGFRFALSGLLLAFTVSCSCERTEHKPYTPFGIATSLPPSPSNTGLAADAGAPHALTFRRGAAELLEPAREVFEVQAARWTAPPDSRFAQVLPIELPQEGSALVAWVVPVAPDPTRAPGELWVYTKPAAARRLKAFPAFVPVGANCKEQIHLERTGPQTVTLDVSATCSSGMIARAPTRSLSVLAPARAQPELIELRLAPAVEADQLSVQVDSTDQDNDSRDDVRLEVSLASAGTQAATARFVWLDRAAGLARDYDEPRASFTSLGSIELVRAKGATTSPRVLPRISNARRLYAYVCKESGAFRLTDENANALSCGSLQGAFDWYSQAEVRAAITQKNFSAALSALSRADWWGAGLSKKPFNQLSSDLRAAIGERAFTATSIPLNVREPGAGPHYSPLTFQGQDLLALTREGVVRIRDGKPEDASDEIDAWPQMVFGPHSERLLDTNYPCDEPFVKLQAQHPEGQYSTALVTDLLAPRPGNCSGTQAFFHPEVRAIQWTDQGPSALFGPLRLGPAQTAPHAGSPVSPDGHSAVSTSPLGLFVVSPEDQFLVKSNVDIASASDCVVSNGARRIACRQHGGVLLLGTEASAPSR